MEKFCVISVTRDLMGATYIILKVSAFMVPSALAALPISLSTVSSATLVLPAPVGAHSSRFSSPFRAASYSCEER